MNTVSRWSVSLKMLQNRLFVTSNVMNVLSMSRASRTAQIVLSKTLHTPTHTRCGVFSNILCRGSRWQFASMRCKIQSIPTLQSVRALSTSGTVQGILSKLSDNKPPDMNLVYTGPLSNMVKMVKLFSVSTSGLSLIIILMLFTSSETGAMKILGGSMASMLFLTPIALHWISKSYVTQIYFDHTTDTFTSYTVNFFLASVRQDFKPADVEIPAVRNLMTSVVVKGKPLLIDPRAFIHPNHYSHLMGYDKLPDDFSVEDIKKAMEDFSEEEQRKD